MSIDVEVLSEVWNIVKEYVPQKERQALADHVISTVADHSISENELKAFGGTDSYLKRALQDYLGEYEEDEEEEDEDY